MSLQPIQTEVIVWYKKNKRDLPWRNTTDPYKIMLSEIMLQQTQVPRVIEKYNLFLQNFPTVEDLAATSTTNVLTLWSGLGYNRRALNLHKAAKMIVEVYDKKVPRAAEQLQTLAGIGNYTASAIQAFAYNKRTAVLDINIKRIVSRVYATVNNEQLKEIAEYLVPQTKSRIWNNAMMDIGALHCRPQPSCNGCPFSKICKWNNNNSRIEIKASKQSKFIGSNRYYRGTILKILAKKESINSTLKQIIDYFPKQLQQPEQIRQAIVQLQNEEFIQFKKKNYSLNDKLNGRNS